MINNLEKYLTTQIMSSAIKFPCKNYEYNATNSDQAIQYDLCDSWVHIKCNDLNYID